MNCPTRIRGIKAITSRTYRDRVFLFRASGPRFWWLCLFPSHQLLFFRPPPSTRWTAGGKYTKGIRSARLDFALIQMFSAETSPLRCFHVASSVTVNLWPAMSVVATMRFTVLFTSR